MNPVAIIMGSASDFPTMKAAKELLDELGIGADIEVVSAHRTPEKMMAFAKGAAGKGYKVIIAGAGGAAHLPGMVASLTTLPVIGVPIKSSNSIDGWDSILSILQMPNGIPGATGALNAAKGQDFVIESVGTMEIKPEILFIYNFSYGTSEFKERLINRAKQLGVTISFNNMANEKELVSAYNQASLTVFPSRLEPLGLVPLESMACGTPVIGIAEAGIRETIQDGENGLLTERDPIEFGNAISKLFSDKLLWKSISEEGIKRVADRWTWEQSCNRLEKNINKTINKYRSLNLQD